jgi:lysophospholipase L1-like esterase
MYDLDSGSPPRVSAAPPSPAKRVPQIRSRQRTWPKVVMLGGGLLIGCLLSEMLVLVIMGEQPKFPRHVVRAPWGLRYNDPGSSYRHKSADMTAYFTIDRQGLRSDRDFEYAKAPGIKRIVSLGDSFTIGYEVDASQCFSSVLESELRHAGIAVEVLNAGVSGFSTAEELLYLERELIRYEPDVVLVSFYGNDLDDNLRTGLFRMDGARLVVENADYVPGGAVANYLNTSTLFNFLSAYSNAFALAKERLTDTVKRSAMDANAERIRAGGHTRQAASSARADPGMEMTAAIFERMYGFLHQRNIPLIIHSIPSPAQPLQAGATHGPDALIEQFPLDHFDTHRAGLYFVSGRELLATSGGSHLLYWTRSNGHWTPFSHSVAGARLAKLIVEEHLLR